MDGDNCCVAARADAVNVQMAKCNLLASSHCMHGICSTHISHVCSICFVQRPALRIPLLFYSQLGHACGATVCGLCLSH